MMEKTATITPAVVKDFQTADVTLISGGHFIHDVYTAFMAPLLPEIIRTLHISLTQAGALSAAMQVPSLLNPLIGYLDDRRNLRLGMILAPGITATLLSSIGLAPNYASLMFLLLIAGLSIAAFHATAPARLGRISGKNIGRAMSFFMGGGELGRSVGPLVAVWAVATLSLKGMIPLAVAGWTASLVLWLRFGRLDPTQIHYQRPNGLIPNAFRFFFPVTIIVLLRGLIISGLGNYLPTLLSTEGANLFTSGGALALYQFAGTAGAVFGGTLSDRFGRRRVLAFSMGGASLLLLVFLRSSGWFSIPILVCMGLFNLTLQPIMLALVQDTFPEHRSTANGTYMALSFISYSVGSIVVGALGDHLGLRTAFGWCAFLSMFAIPILLALPRSVKHQ